MITVGKVTDFVELIQKNNKALCFKMGISANPWYIRACALMHFQAEFRRSISKPEYIERSKKMVCLKVGSLRNSALSG